MRVLGIEPRVLKLAQKEFFLLVHLKSPGSPYDMFPVVILLLKENLAPFMVQVTLDV